MTYGVISDIHSNLPALRVVLERLSGVDGFLCLGDIVGYGAEPNECCATVRALHCPTLMGNHDAGAVGKLGLEWFNRTAAEALSWTARALTAENLAFLEALPECAAQNGILLAHGSPLDPWDYIYEPYGAAAALAALEEPLCLFGHTHLAMAFIKGEESGRLEQILLPEGGRLKLEADHRYLINPGSVGQPRDGNPQAACAIYDNESKTIEFLRLDYAVQEEQEKMREAGLSEALIVRLGVGL